MAFKAGSIIAVIGGDVGPLRKSIATAKSLASGFVSDVGGLFGRLGSVIASPFTQLGVTLSGGALAAGLGALAVSMVKLAADAEQAEVAFTTMLGGLDKAKALMGELQQFAAATPFNTTELVSASKALLAFGVAQDQIIPTMRTLGDVAAGLGIPVNDLAQLYGKARVQGRLMAEDVNQLTGRGIPVIHEFAKQFGVADSEVKKLVESGQIGFANLQRALVSMTTDGGKFTGLMAAQSQTVSGLFSTLQDSISMSMMRAGQSITKGLDVRAAIGSVSDGIAALAAGALPVLDAGIAKLGGLGVTGQKTGSLLFTAFETVGKGVGWLADTYELIVAGYDKLTAATGYWVDLAVQGFAKVADAANAVLSKVGKGFDTSFIDAFAKSIDDRVDQLNQRADKHWENFRRGTNSKAVEQTFASIRQQADATLKQMQQGPGNNDLMNRPLQIEKQDLGPSPAEQKAATELKDKLKTFRDGIATPVEKFQAAVTELKGWKAKGLITGDELNRGVAEAQAEALKETGRDGGASGRRGSSGLQLTDLPTLVNNNAAGAVRLAFQAQQSVRENTADKAHQREVRTLLERIAKAAEEGKVEIATTADQ